MTKERNLIDFDDYSDDLSDSVLVSAVDTSKQLVKSDVGETTIECSKSVSCPLLSNTLPSTEQTELKMTAIDGNASNSKEVHESDLRIPVVVRSTAVKVDEERVFSTPVLLDTLVDVKII